MRTVVNKVFSRYYGLRNLRLKRMMTNPEKFQAQIFQRLIYAAKNTEWGQLHNFKNIKTPKEFAQQIPLQDYEGLFPYIERMMLGEPDVLWPGRISFFSKSSGTTNDKSKFIPVSPENIRKCHIRGTWDTMNLYYVEHPNSNIFSGKNFLMSGSLHQYEPYPKTTFGDVSALMIKNMPYVARPFFEPAIDVCLLPEWEEKLFKMADVATQPEIAKQVTMIGGVPTWVLVFFRHILEKTGKEHMLAVWPAFEAYIHGGVSLLPYKKELNRYLPSDQVSYRQVYNASEGYFGTQILDGDDDMLLLMDNGVYYEFMPLSELKSSQPITLTLDEIEIGETYALIITTNSGLWRYQIGDTIKFTSKHPFKFKIMGRTKQQLNVFGEEVMVDNTDTALALTNLEFGVEVREYTVGPIFMNEGKKGGHEWLIEFIKTPNNLAAFQKRLDQHLQSVNSDYEAKRYRNMALKNLTLREVPKGTFEKWMRLRGKYGGQNKVPRLANHRHFIKEILCAGNLETIPLR